MVALARALCNFCDQTVPLLPLFGPYLCSNMVRRFLFFEVKGLCKLCFDGLHDHCDHGKRYLYIVLDSCPYQSFSIGLSTVCYPFSVTQLEISSTSLNLATKTARKYSTNQACFTKLGGVRRYYGTMV